MPPRATAAANAASTAQSQQDSILETEGIDAYELPKALITRIAKSGVCFLTLLAEDASDASFILYLLGCDVCLWGLCLLCAFRSGCLVPFRS